MKLWNKIKLFFKPLGELERLSMHGVHPCFSDKTYQYLAGKLYFAMEGFGTDVSLITKVFNCVQNDADFIKLDQAFGYRYCDISVLHGNLFPKNLQWFLRGDLCQSEINALNHSLIQRGITKQIKS